MNTGLYAVSSNVGTRVCNQNGKYFQGNIITAVSNSLWINSATSANVITTVGTNTSVSIPANLIVNGTSTIGGTANFNIITTSSQIITSTEPSTDTNTGALVIYGGLACNGPNFFGGINNQPNQPALFWEYINVCSSFTNKTAGNYIICGIPSGNSTNGLYAMNFGPANTTGYPNNKLETINITYNNNYTSLPSAIGTPSLNFCVGFNPVTNTSTTLTTYSGWTIPASGLYYVNFQFLMGVVVGTSWNNLVQPSGANTNGDRSVYIINYTSHPEIKYGPIYNTMTTNLITTGLLYGYSLGTCSALIPCNSGDVIGIVCYQNSGYQYPLALISGWGYAGSSIYIVKIT